MAALYLLDGNKIQRYFKEAHNPLRLFHFAVTLAYLLKLNNEVPISVMRQ